MDSRNAELKPGYRRVENTKAPGTRTLMTSSVFKKEGAPRDIYYVNIPKLSPNEVIIPDTMKLTFEFTNSNTKSWFKNNLGRILCEDLKIVGGGKTVYDNTGEGTFETYKDLWRSETERKQMLEYGIANENIRKLMSGDDSADTSEDDDVLLKDYQKVLKIKLGKILEGYGPYAPYFMQDISNQVSGIERNHGRPIRAKGRNLQTHGHLPRIQDDPQQGICEQGESGVRLRKTAVVRPHHKVPNSRMEKGQRQRGRKHQHSLQIDEGDRPPVHKARLNGQRRISEP